MVSKSVAELFRKELMPYKNSGRTIHFTPEKPLSIALVKKIVKARMKENEATTNAKKASRAN